MFYHVLARCHAVQMISFIDQWWTDIPLLTR